MVCSIVLPPVRVVSLHELQRLADQLRGVLQTPRGLGICPVFIDARNALLYGTGEQCKLNSDWSKTPQWPVTHCTPQDPVPTVVQRAHAAYERNRNVHGCPKICNPPGACSALVGWKHAWRCITKHCVGSSSTTRVIGSSPPWPTSTSPTSTRGFRPCALAHNPPQSPKGSLACSTAARTSCSSALSTRES